ncbi:MarR family winged helix-turn-helix transcriptional regulator [Corynebacterium vitaeruminis]|nr:MarR family winged helix-turn-helix transcriptional regulator [Corynebacterium vitaeruminis]
MEGELDKPRWLDEEEQKFWRLMLAANRKIERTIDVALQQANGLTSSEFAVLVTLSEAPERQLRLRDLCAGLDWDRSRTSHQITRMERRGLVNKVKCEGDGRGVIVSLTADGLARLDEAAPSHVETVRRLVIDDLNHQDIPVISRFFQGILDEEVLEDCDCQD